MADNSSTLDSFFPFHSSFLARDNEALTKALQISISDTTTATASPCSSISTSDSILNQLQWADPGAISPPLQTRPVKGATAQTGRITKRKPRASKKSQTTYINADPENFRQMVQQVTGIHFEPGSVDEPVYRPEPQRIPSVQMQQQTCLLPTLDTSAHMLERAARSGFAGAGRVERAGNGYGFESGMSFPTLESWGMIL
ncbi:hypothetical protein LUZ60_003992 [Juncus effusus]|nr:hypothetical protein LUZ60_003992 [Juncus effusus]